MTGGHEPGAVDRHLSEDVRSILEQRFWRPVEEISTLESLSGDGSLALAPHAHPALFSDHGIVHARDVAAGVVGLEGIADGRLMPPRPVARREFVVGLAVLLGYLHDVGMHDATPDGRRIHALHAAHTPFSGAMDDVLDRFRADDGAVVRRITAVDAIAPFRTSPDVVLRELASLGVAHSKSTVPAAALADLSALRKVLQHAVLVDLEHHRRDTAITVRENDLPRRLGANERWYANPAHDAYAWLDSPEPAYRALADDAIDAVRLIRAADALRQRGTTLRTAAGYEIYIDAETGKAVFSLTNSAGDRLFLLRADSPLSSGEANVRKAVLTPKGDLRVSFHRGRFSSSAALAYAGDAAARVVADISADVLGAFEARRPSPDLPLPARDPRSMRVELERPRDEPAFAEMVAEALARHDRSLLTRVFVAADLENASSEERARYHAGIAISAESSEAGEILEALGARGLKVTAVDRARAFEDVRSVRVAQGEVLVEAGSWPTFVYIAVESSLRIQPLGGYRELDVPPWIPIGVTGVVRRAERNGTVVAAGPGDVLMIPGELFVREWFRPYEPGEIANLLAEIAG